MSPHNFYIKEEETEQQNSKGGEGIWKKEAGNMFSHTFDTTPHTMLAGAIFGTEQQSTMNKLF